MLRTEHAQREIRAIITILTWWITPIYQKFLEDRGNLSFQMFYWCWSRRVKLWRDLSLPTSPTPLYLPPTPPVSGPPPHRERGLSVCSHLMSIAYVSWIKNKDHNLFLTFIVSLLSIDKCWRGSESHSGPRFLLFKGLNGPQRVFHHILNTFIRTNNDTVVIWTFSNVTCVYLNLILKTTMWIRCHLE